MNRSDNELKPLNGHTLIVGIAARISGCAKQKEVGLGDQVDHAKEDVAELYDGAVEYRKYSRSFVFSFSSQVGPRLPLRRVCWEGQRCKGRKTEPVDA